MFLERADEEIVAIGGALIDTASRESGLPRGRIDGERGRTVGQLKLFAGVLRSGDWMGLRIGPALPDRTPLPRPDLRLRTMPLGPVAVFGASNFPLAFSRIAAEHPVPIPVYAEMSNINPSSCVRCRTRI